MGFECLIIKKKCIWKSMVVLWIQNNKKENPLGLERESTGVKALAT